MEKSLFISSFDRALHFVYGLARKDLKLGSYYVWHYFFLFFLILSLILVWCRFRHRLRPRWRHFSMAVIVVFLIRVMLFDNPLAWRHYKRVIPYDTMSGLSAKQALDEIEQRELSSPKLHYLIIGSSLTYSALYAMPSLDPQSRLLPFFGMMVMEYAFCGKKIEAFNPSRILLYITNYDLGNVVSDEKLDSFYPFDGFKCWLLYSLEKRQHLLQRRSLSIKRSLAGRFFPEYRYSLIPREYLNRLLGRTTQTLEAGKTKEEFLKCLIGKQNNAIQHFSKDNFDINLVFLDEFLRFCRKKHINVVMLEGRINPLAETPQSRELSLRAFQKLKEMADKYDHVRFVPASELMPLGLEDFRDMLHMKEESSSVKYSQSVMAYLQKMPPFPDR